NPGAIDIPGVVPLQLDITDPASVAAAAAVAGDITLLVNNAGSSTHSILLDDDLAGVRLEMETHYFGTLAVTREFAPILARGGGGAILNVLSVLSWFTSPASGAYAAAKAAEWSLTNAVRQQLAPAGTLVTALHVGYMDTDMAAHVEGPKSDPAAIANLALDGVEAGEFEVVADEVSRTVKASLSGPVTGTYPSLAPAAAH
ncbi:MAG TPA: SDR family oxidoreductase, partial [Pseudonocardia sp.]|nr:SDR family oxidoreductase [Pseudonocardia sp.]